MPKNQTPGGSGLFFRFRSFRTRLTVFFVGLLLFVLGVAFVVVDLANSRYARQQINTNLEVDARVFSRLLASRKAGLVQAARLLSGDFAVKSAYASDDRATLVSALGNHQMRIDAEVMMLFSIEGEVLASTLDLPIDAGSGAFSELTDAAEDSDDDEAAMVMVLDGRPFQVVLVPLLAPLPVARIGVGFVLDQEFVQTFKELTLSDVSLMRRAGDRWKVEASTLPDPAALVAALGDMPGPGQSFVLSQAGRDVVTLMQPVNSGTAFQIVLQRPLDTALAPYERIRWVLLLLVLEAFLVSLLGAHIIAGGVTRPVQRLVAATRRIQAGDYTAPVQTNRIDEMGELAAAFNQMGQGLAERDQVRDLLGKIVDPSVAEELLSKGLELGGEERPVSILFSDIIGFTELSEKHRPADLLNLLNRYLSGMSQAIEQQGGVVDKYIGDSIMALFGAPLAHGDDAGRAIRAALDMDTELAGLNQVLNAEGIPSISTGIGISTGLVVAGNMGSAHRMNYTVIGDAVNLASRLERLTRFYGVPVIVCPDTVRAAPEFSYRELDVVRVHGKHDPVRIFEPLAPGTFSKADLKRHGDLLTHYRARDWHQASKILDVLNEVAPDDPVYDLYSMRIATHRAEPPPHGWDAVEIFD